MVTSKYFSIQELVCPHVYKRWGNRAWQFIDKNLIDTLNYIREGIGNPIYVNNWDSGGHLSQRGLRCNCCQLVKIKTSKNQVYLSQHIFGKAVDFDVKGLAADEVRSWIRDHWQELPHPIRMEIGVNWVHIDVMNDGKVQIIEFEP